MTTKEEPKKLYKIATETILYELFDLRNLYNYEQMKSKKINYYSVGKTSIK